MAWHYDVQPNDCLSVIAQDNGETLAQVEADNPQFSANWNLIYAGQEVTIGGAAPAGGPLSGPTINEHPLRAIANLQTERIDEGQDFGGTGPIYGVGSGTIISTDGSGWPGGVYILERIDSGPGAGKYIYFAENITPSVVPGQHVDYNTVIGTMTGGIEIGWGTSTPQQTLAIATTGYTEGQPTPEGQDMANFLLSLIKVPNPSITSIPAPQKPAAIFSPSATIDGVQNAGEIFNYLVDHGLTHNGAAGVVGNIGQESGGNPESEGSGGGGLIGWTPLRPGLVTGDASVDLMGQLDAIVSYIETYGSIPDINAHSASPTEAADWFMSNYERCDPAYCNAGNRESIAMAVASAG